MASIRSNVRRLGDAFAQQLDANPLVHLRNQAIARNQCDASGFRLPGAPWAFQLAQVPSLTKSKWPSLRTVGWQYVNEEGLFYMVRNNDHLLANGNAKKKRLCEEVAICYTEGMYPPPKGGPPCVQWRVEGVAVRVSTGGLLKTAPVGSIAQILAITERERMGERTARDSRPAASASSESLTQSQFRTRTGMIDSVTPPDADSESATGDVFSKPLLIAETEAYKNKIGAGLVGERLVAEACAAYRVIPYRMEMMQSGDVWERFEWVNGVFEGVYGELEKAGDCESLDSDGNSSKAKVEKIVDGVVLQWGEPRRLVPY